MGHTLKVRGLNKINILETKNFVRQTAVEREGVCEGLINDEVIHGNK